MTCSSAQSSEQTKERAEEFDAPARPSSETPADGRRRGVPADRAIREPGPTSARSSIGWSVSRSYFNIPTTYVGTAPENVPNVPEPNTIASGQRIPPHSQAMGDQNHDRARAASGGQILADVCRGPCTSVVVLTSTLPVWTSQSRRTTILQVPRSFRKRFAALATAFCPSE